MKYIITLLFTLNVLTVSAQDVKIQGPKRQQSTVSKPKPKTSSGTQSRKPTAPLRWDDSLKAICYDGQTYPMAFVEGGTFTMGEKYDNGKWFEHDTERYGYKRCDNSVLVSSTLHNYYIGKFEVTQELWEKVMGSNPTQTEQKKYGSFPAEFVGKRKPITEVSTGEIRQFLSKLNNITGMIFRLPTEEQWEFAAIGGNKSQSFKYSGSNSLNSVGWYSENSGGAIHEVGQKAPNELGIYDMSGNVLEICSDEYGYKKLPGGTYRIVYDNVHRGGAYSWPMEECSISYRFNFDSYDIRSRGWYGIGFRIVLSDE